MAHVDEQSVLSLHERTAYHEAGHAVIGVVAGRTLKRITIVRKGDILGVCDWEVAKNSFGDEIDFSDELDLLCEDRLIDLLAGVIGGINAEKHLCVMRGVTCHYSLSSEEKEHYDALLMHLSADEDKRAKIENMCATRIEQLWPTIDAVAKRLMEKSTLDGSEVHEMTRELSSQRHP